MVEFDPHMILTDGDDLSVRSISCNNNTGHSSDDQSWPLAALAPQDSPGWPRAAGSGTRMSVIMRNTAENLWQVGCKNLINFSARLSNLLDCTRLRAYYLLCYIKLGFGGVGISIYQRETKILDSGCP